MAGRTERNKADIKLNYVAHYILCILRRRVAAGALRVATRRYEWPALIRLLYVQS